MNRGDLSNAQWNRLEPLLSPQKRPSNDHRTLVNGIVWVFRTGAPWRDLPERYGSWATVYRRYANHRHDRDLALNEVAYRPQYYNETSGESGGSVRLRPTDITVLVRRGGAAPHQNGNVWGGRRPPPR